MKGQGVSRPRIVAHTLSYPPHRRIGAELATHGLLEHLTDDGWRAIVVPHTVRGLVPRRVEHVHTVTPELARACRPDVVMAHLPFVQQAREQADQHRVPLVVSVHGGPPGWMAAKAAGYRPDLLIANSLGMAVGLERTGIPVLIQHPPIQMPSWPLPEPDGLAVTLINASVDKGALVVRELAKRLPDIPFLVVEGGYGAQVDLRAPNVTVLPHGTPMEQVWSMTRVLLVPSVEESWGMVAAEAMTRGIPVLGSRAEGLAECLGPAMPRTNIGDLDTWTVRLTLAYEDPGWSELHIAALRRAAELDPAAGLMRTRREIAELIGREDPVIGTRFKNVRTGDVVTATPGTRLHNRLSTTPLVWQPVQEEAGSGAPAARPPRAAEATSPDPASLASPGVTVPTATQPKPSAPVGEWLDYAVACGADRNAAARASKATLIALYGS